MRIAPHLIVGAGAVGTALARHLADTEIPVRIATRSGSGPEHPVIERIAVDASDPEALATATAAAGASVIYNCANPASYQKWEAQWPPVAAALLLAAERSGAVLVTLSNLYGYGPVDAPITPQTALNPSDHKVALRARMWLDALNAHQDGRVRATEARASDYFGPTAPIASTLLARYAAATLAGRTATVFADPDQPHSWTASDDVARTLAALGQDERAWGSAWHVPTNPPVSVREVLHQLAEHTGSGQPRLRVAPRRLLRAGGMLVPVLREVTGVLYQFDRPFVVDSAETTAML